MRLPYSFKQFCGVKPEAVACEGKLMVLKGFKQTNKINTNL